MIVLNNITCLNNTLHG